MRALPKRISTGLDWLAVHATVVFGSMYCFFAFVVYGALGAVFTEQQPTLLYWSNWVQLWALPLLLVGTNLLGRESERRARETHDAVMAELQLLKEIHGQHEEVRD